MISPQEIFVIGSGASLNRLRPEEVEHVNNARAVVSFNMYLPFWKRIGIVPTHYILLDSVHSNFVYRMVFQTVKKNGLWLMKFLLNRYWARRLYESFFAFNWQKFKRMVRRRGSTNMLRVDRRLDINFIDFGPWDRLEKIWAGSFDEPLFHFRGTMTTAINAAHIVDPQATIKLLGMDLNTPEYFFQDQMPRLLKLKAKEGRADLDWQYNLEKGKHGTVVEYKDLPPVTEAFPYIKERVEATGGRLVCCNPTSLLVEEGCVPYGSVMER